MNFLTGRARSRSRKNSISMMITSEKWRRGQKVTRREDDIADEDASDEEEPQFDEITNWVQEYFDRKSDTTDLIDQDIEVLLTKKQTLILSTLVPDEILQMDKFVTSEPKRFVGVLLMADVSGFTALSERYNNMGKGGTYRLTATLNTYLGSLIEVIYNNGGDIIKFAGDAFLALWKTDKRTFLGHTIHTVITCALIIQHSYSTYETDVKVNLRVKLAISAGNLIFAPIGSGIDMNYVVVGLPVIEAKAAESVCASGEVKLTPTAWGHCYSRNYDHTIDENGYVTIKAILYDPHDSNVHRPFVGFNSMIRQIKKTFSTIENLPDFLWDSSKVLNVADALKKSEVLSLRKSILLAEEKNIGSDIRKFLIRPVLTQIDAHQPLEYLTEMRHVSILFITLKPMKSSFAQLITIVNNAYQITCEIVYKSMGCVNKIILFDKDTMMLVIFGLRGFKHESEAQAALKCAYSIKKSVSALDGVLQVSIGVTTGPVYCGVVGHPLRREFTVIGAIVNKAARLMCGYRNKITCDETTFIKSKMSSNGFTLLPSIELKGIGTSGKVYEYTEEIRVKELYEIPMIPPLLDRCDELEYFETWLKESKTSAYRSFDALLMMSESRYGKTRLIEWMARYAKNMGYGVCSIKLSSIHSATAYLALSQIINQLLGLKEPIEGFSKEEKIVQLLQVYSDDLCYLNNVIKVRFAYHEGIHALDEDQRKKKAMTVFNKLIYAITERHVVFLDDLHNLDPYSWEFISAMFSSLKIYIVLTCTRGKYASVHNWLYSVFINSNIRKMSLGPLESQWIPALACQILDVDAVAHDLCKALKSKCKGAPGLIESFIIHLFSTGALEIKNIPNDEVDEWTKNEDLEFPDPALLHPQALDMKDQEALDKFMENDLREEKNVCIVIAKNELKTNINVQNIDALIMIQIDSLTPYQQLLLKIASVIGNVVPRDLLENIMYENNPVVTAKAIKRLFALNILTCANADSTVRWGRKTFSETILSEPAIYSTNLVCECKFEYIPEECENIPKYGFCNLMRFRNKNSRQTCYELLPINQKKEFHSRIVNYLDNTKQKCTSCGGKIMLVQPILEIKDKPRITESSLSSKEMSASQSISSNSDDKEPANKSGTPNVNERESIKKSLSASMFKKKSRPPTKVSSDFLTTSLNASDIAGNSQHQPILKLNPNRSKQSHPESESTELSTKHKTGKKVTMTTSSTININKEFSVEGIQTKIFDMLRAITEAADPKDWNNLGVYDSQDDIRATKVDDNKRSCSVRIEKGVSETNFANCTCAELNITIYEHLIHHANQADLKTKAIEFILTYSYLCILSNSVDNVFTKLQEAEYLCKSLQDLDPFDKKRFSGRIFSLKAAAYLAVGKLNAAKIEIERATKIYDVNVHKVPDYLQIKNIISIFKQQKKRINMKILKSDSIFCLNIATLVYLYLHDERTSRMTALRALNIIPFVDASVIDICDAYTNAIQLELVRGMPDNAVDIEQMAVQALNQTNPIQADELFALGKLFMAAFRARIARGQLAAAIRAGFRALTISRCIRAEDVAIEIIPDLFYILMSRCRIEEAIDVLQYALRSNQYHSISHECETWYYALCLDMILDAGFQLEAPLDISRFAEYSLARGKVAGGGRRRLVVGLWTYWLRANSDKKAKRFETEALSWVSCDDDSTLSTILSAMRLAEGMLESLARKVDDLRKVVDLMELRSIADRELIRLENDTRLLRVVLPRWYLLKANSCKLSGRLSIANGFFNQALEEAKRIDSRLEESLARAALSNSMTWIQNARSDEFENWRKCTEQAHTAWHLLMYKISSTRE